MVKKTIRDFDISSKRVIIRCDFNVPIKDGKIIDDNRIRQSLETIEYALSKKAKIILMSHLGRIKNEEDKKKNSLEIVGKRLSELLKYPVIFIDETRGEKLDKAISSMKDGDIILMQNTRYEDLEGKKESSCDLDLAKYWASLGDVFINDAFGTLHRAHASNVGISQFLPSGIGFLVGKELTALSSLFDPERPFLIILGGSKVSDKIGLIDHLITKCDKLLIGGGMAYTFLEAEGYSIGNSLVDRDSLEFCNKILKQYGNKIILPVDSYCSTSFTNDGPKNLRDINEIEYQEMGLDIGDKTVELFEKYLKDAKMVLWNGPLGVYEFDNYKKGTEAVLTFLSKSDAKTVVGGGDTAAVANELHLAEKLYHVSTGGGATLEYLEGKELPGLKNIEEV